MREMKDSGVEWIGEIPKDWTVSTIKREYRFQTGWTPRTDNAENFEGDKVWVNISDMKEKVICNSQKHISDTAVKKASMSISPVGSLLFAFKLSVGAVSFCGCNLYTNEAIATFLDGENSLNYLYYIAPIYVVQNANENIYGAKLLNQQLIRNAKVALPLLDEQQKIADYLDNKCAQIDAIIARQQEIIEKLKAYKLSVITEAVTKGLNPDVPMKESGVEWIGKTPQSWRVAQLKFFANIRAGITLGKKYGPEIPLREYSYLRVANVQGDHTDLSDVATILAMPEEAEKHQLHPGELLMTEGGDRDKLGRGCVWQGEIPICLHQNHVFAVATNESYLSVYFLDYMTTSNVARSYFDYTAKKTTNLASTNSTTILQFKLPIPPREEQDEIVAYLNSKCQKINDFAAKKKTIITKLTEYKKSLIYEVVTGKKEV